MSISKEMKQAIEALPTGQLFTTSEFHSFGSTENVRKVLTRLSNQGIIKRVTRGVFVRPEIHPKLGEMLPSPEEVIKTLAARTGEHISVHGAEAARQLGLTTQVPMKRVFYTTGHTRSLKICNQEVILKHMSPRKLKMAGTIAGLVITALWYIGKGSVTPNMLEIIKQKLPAHAYQTVLKSTSYMPAWMATLFYNFEHSEHDE